MSFYGYKEGDQIGAWTLVRPSDVCKDRRETWLCRCKCGEPRDVTAKSLARGTSKTGCGCWRQETRSPTFVDLTGQTFGLWTVESFNGMNAIKQSTYNCRCVCGTPRIVAAQPLSTGKSKSCGCNKAASISKAKTKHGMAGTKVHQAWMDMMRRCTNPKTQRWDIYGGRGIKVCDEWLIFENFYRDMGDPAPGLSLDRIDEDGMYQKSNCKWATVQEQNSHLRVERNVHTGLYQSRHPAWNTPEYKSWVSMRSRCSSRNKHMRHLYADRGIAVCAEWEASFEVFLADVGLIPHEGWTLDREENDLGYWPGNCRWADCQTQSQNRRQNQRRQARREVCDGT